MFADLPAPTLSVRLITILLATGFLFLGGSEVVSPSGWDARYGVPLRSEHGLSFVQALGARNMALSLIAIFAALTGMRAALATVFAAISFIAAMDFYIVSTAVGTEHALKHALFVVIMACVSLWVAFSGRQGSK